jgi:nucleoid-associated protein
LVATLGREPAATGGYLVFAEHDHAGENFLLVVLLSTRARPSFDENINLVSTVSLDTDHLRHAGRIRYEGVEPNDDGVVHYVSKSSEGIYFRDFLGCEAVTDSSVQGNYLHSALRQWAEDQEMTAAQRESMMQRTYTYWHECRKEDRPITLTAIANALQPDDPAPLLAHLGAESTGLAGEFPPPRPSVMRRFVKFTFDHAGLKIEFHLTDWLDRVGVTGDTVTIQQAPPELVEQINAAKHGDD